ncbi:long-chain-fatty-acid--CoA ligase [Thermus scotoductus]|uniref:Long-chain fatty acid--CoA ligase n=1 Tax=Thermus scotoductus TaxID=37636 RepID=A0A430UI03_THESC|nr:long-chain fatty acid--CoA ligase [Thermus scotoductus]RTG95236.1 long-chain fatty acid--CoA ligase [Thermus scotoductus]RTH21190.1 long-chain fatty acid--CoA ligase [Thermus scotoductus]RTH26968.1 long-chain fatty acid--CoA ligase [Thermus scotoductus]RTI01265.1 long-chain fatty acid--CoA ligase [Thermus scotoductus]RTI34559.1 long-chain fatty acid--CoA ligase [Thermus scotoductus]
MHPWYTHYDPGVPKEAPRPWLLTDLLRENARRYPHKEALEFLGRSLSYRNLWQQVEAFAKGLQEAGLKPGDRVAIMLPNSPQFVIAFYGTLLAGGVAVNINPMYTPRELGHQLRDSGARVLVILDLLLPRYQEVKAEAPVEVLVRTGIQDYLPFPKNLLYPLMLKRKGQAPRSLEGTPWRAFLKPGNPQPVPLDLDDLALLQYTGGTTGVAKGAMLTHRNLSSNALQVRSWIPDFQEGEEVVLGAIPFFHVYGMTVAMNLALLGAAKLVLLPRPEIKPIVEAIEKHRVTLFPGVPTLYVAFNNFPGIEKRNLRSIRACISGSAPLPLEVADRFERLTGAKLVEGYGLTEASPVTHCNPLHGVRKLGSVGLPFPGVEAKVVDEEGQEVPIGEVGELVVKGPNIMKGYWNRPEETQKALQDGWLFTGDMAKMDEDGYFYIVDRKKDMIIAGGYNIYPREVEEILYQHEAVQEAAVVGVPDPYRGETVAAFIVLKEAYRGKVTEKDIETFCRQNLAAYKVPRIIEFRDSLPKTSVGKILKRELTKEMAAKR